MSEIKNCKLCGGKPQGYCFNMKDNYEYESFAYYCTTEGCENNPTEKAGTDSGMSYAENRWNAQPEPQP